MIKKLNGRYTRCHQQVIGYTNKVITLPFFKYPPVETNFKINLTNNSTQYNGTIYATWLQDAVHFMEQIVTGLSYTSAKRVLTVDASFGNLNLPNGHFAGQGGPGDMATNFDGNIDMTEIVKVIDALDIYGDYITVKRGSVKFCSCPSCYPANNPNPRFFYTAVHELFHVLGYGTLWNGDFRLVDTGITPILGVGGVMTLPNLLAASSNPLLGSVFSLMFGFNPAAHGLHRNSNNIGTGSTPNNPQYNGYYGLAAYRDYMNNQSLTYIPLEPAPAGATVQTSGGSALAHWDRNISNELMIYATSPSSWLSKFTVTSLKDIGYEVNYEALEIPLSQWITS